MVIENLITVAKFASASPFTEAQVRWHVFNRKNNGLDDFKAVIKVGRRVYLDKPAYELWIASMNTITHL